MIPLVPLFVYSPFSNTPIAWGGVSTTIGGIATFYPTDDETINGNALFSIIKAVQATALFNTNSAVNVPLATIKSISIDNKTIIVNVIKGKTLIALGETIEFVPDGTTVYLNVVGI